MNDINITDLPPKRVLFSTLAPGDWFWATSTQEMFPCMKTDSGGFVSPANGHYDNMMEGQYDKYVIPCPRGTLVTISVGTRDR